MHSPQASSNCQSLFGEFFEVRHCELPSAVAYICSLKQGLRGALNCEILTQIVSQNE